MVTALSFGQNLCFIHFSYIEFNEEFSTTIRFVFHHCFVEKTLKNKVEHDKRDTLYLTTGI